MKRSLLWKSNDRTAVFKEKDYEIISGDLGLKKILSIMSREPEIKMTKEIFLSSVSYDNDDIVYRQGILSALEANKDSIGLLDVILSNLNDMKVLHRTLKPDKLVPFTMLRLKKLEFYCKVMDGLRLLFCSDDNEEISEIASEIEEEYNDSGISDIKETIDKCHEVISSFKSFDLGINMDDMGAARESIILGFNDYTYSKSNLVDKITAEYVKERNKLSVAPIKDIYEKGQYIMFTNRVYTEFETLLNSEMHEIRKLLDRHSDVITSSVIDIREELLIYYGALRLKNFLNDRDMQVTLPDVGCSMMEVKGLYSISMAIESIASENREIKIVSNDLSLGDDENLMVVTGPNDGGKTVYLEAITVSQLLGQIGIYYPAEIAQIKTFRSIFTHFPKDEDISFGTGRLGEEAVRFSDIILSLKEPALISTNEPYVTTSPDEGLSILVHTIKKICSGRVDVFIVTHYLDLLDELGELACTKTYTAELAGGERTYRMIPDVPNSLSHAMDIARLHGIDKESIKKLLIERI